ncbi:AzlC family ABC transporter permease [Actinomadura sp. 6K520]|jgi:predicted branched-subunit amino acid permease|uniref:AzlC family ABC transporter permease n=1 Tax=Actinomadura sp. 6K520 TaxID=2530364 RepID=UPI0010480B38|nr:AzlC family ABC transporter permease [Actinomadura sp. 6K520]TDE28177.1 branched-chain amino acid ABC transporter permease [Actinomadura sp. 6K520]
MSATGTEEVAGADDSARGAAVRDGLGVGLAVGVSGLAFGAAAVTAGLTVAQACVLSLLAFTGASQFALAGVIGGGGGLVAGTLGAVLLGGRNTLYGMRLARMLDVRGWRRLATAHVVIDETTAVATAQRGRTAARAGFYTTAISLYLTWNATTLLGAAGAARLGDPEAIGLDVLGPAAFLALLWPRLFPARSGAAGGRPPAAGTGRPEVRVALAAAVIALAATPLLPPGVPVMLAAVAAVPALLSREEKA